MIDKSTKSDLPFQPEKQMERKNLHNLNVLQDCQVLEWLTAFEAADYLKVKVRTILLWARQGKIKGYALSGMRRHIWRFRRGDLDQALSAKDVLKFSPPSVLPERRIE